MYVLKQNFHIVISISFMYIDYSAAVKSWRHFREMDVAKSWHL